MAECWLGIDLGTTSVKVVLLDCHGNFLSSESRQTQADVVSDVGDCGYEQDPSKIVAVAEDLTIKIASPYKGNIKASLPVQSDPHQLLSTGYGCATLFWLAHHRPSLVKDEGFTACGTVMDYLVCKLCDLDHPTTSDQLAASFGFYNKDTITWDTVLSQTGMFPHHLLPDIAPAGTVVGHSCAWAGLPKGIPVFAAMGDVQCAMRAVLSSSKDAAVNISTSIQLGFAVPSEKKREIANNSPQCISFFPYFSGQDLALFAGLNGGNAIQCFAESIAQWVCDLGIASTVSPSSLLPKLQQLSEKAVAMSSPPSTSSLSHRLTVDPVLYGERHDVSMKASISGLDYMSLRNVGLLFRELSEGIVNHLCRMVSPEYLTTQGITRLRVSGSVPRANTVVMDRLKELYSGSSNTEFAASGASNAGDVVEKSGGDAGGTAVVRSRLEVVVDTQGLEAVSSAVGAARVACDHR